MYKYLHIYSVQDICSKTCSILFLTRVQILTANYNTKIKIKILQQLVIFSRFSTICISILSNTQNDLRFEMPFILNFECNSYYYILLFMLMSNGLDKFQFSVWKLVYNIYSVTMHHMHRRREGGFLVFE